MPIPVARAAEFYQPPAELPPDAWSLVPPAELAWRWIEYRQQRRVTPPEGYLVGERAWARINHNRWVADCVCGSAQVVTPDDPRFACPECGWGWVQLVFPEDPSAVEAEVDASLPHERNWTHPEEPAATVAAQAPRPPKAHRPTTPEEG